MLFGNKATQDFTVNEILHTYSETIEKLEAREDSLGEQGLALKVERDKISHQIENIEREAKRGAKAINFLNKMFEEMGKE